MNDGNEIPNAQQSDYNIMAGSAGQTAEVAKSTGKSCLWWLFALPIMGAGAIFLGALIIGILTAGEGLEVELQNNFAPVEKQAKPPRVQSVEETKAIEQWRVEQARLDAEREAQAKANAEARERDFKALGTTAEEYDKRMAEYSKKSAAANRDQEHQQKFLEKHKHEVALLVQNEITSSLKAPATANFQPLYEAEVGFVDSDTIEVVTWVDAQNSFGALIRTRFAATVKLKNESFTVKQIRELN